MANGIVGTLVLDLDGVVYLDTEGVPGAGQALEACRDLGWQLVFATNNSSKTGAIVARHLAERTGFAADPAAAITSAMSAAHHLRGRASRAMVVGSPAISEELARVGVATVDALDVDAVVVGLDRDITYDRIDRAARAVRAGAAFIATNVDTTYPTPDGLAPGAGTIVAAIAAASGVGPTNCGKPTEVFGSLVRSRLRGDRVVVVGDRPETDLALGVRNGWDTVLVLSGVTASVDDVPEDLRPKTVITTITELPSVLDETAPAPTNDGG